jgi:hypothetical protein
MGILDQNTIFALPKKANKPRQRQGSFSLLALAQLSEGHFHSIFAPFWGILGFTGVK